MPQRHLTSAALRATTGLRRACARTFRRASSLSHAGARALRRACCPARSTSGCTTFSHTGPAWGCTGARTLGCPGTQTLWRARWTGANRGRRTGCSRTGAIGLLTLHRFGTWSGSILCNLGVNRHGRSQDEERCRQDRCDSHEALPN